MSFEKRSDKTYNDIVQPFKDLGQYLENTIEKLLKSLIELNFEGFKEYRTSMVVCSSPHCEKKYS